MLKTKLSIIFVISLFLLSIIFVFPKNQNYKVTEVNSPIDFVLNGERFVLSEFQSFHAQYTVQNKILAEKLGITEDEAFALGVLGKYWASNLMRGRHVLINNNDDMIYLKYSYRDKFIYSGFCFKDGKPCYQEGFENRLSEIRNSNYKVLDVETDVAYALGDSRVRNLNKFILMKNRHLPKDLFKKIPKTSISQVFKTPISSTIIDKGAIKIFVTDSTSKFIPDRTCSSDICKEILSEINNSKETIDIAIYGYSRTHEIEKALINAQKRGVKLRLVYDINQKGENIYSETDAILNIIKDNISDKYSDEVGSLMHNKFYIFDNKKVITGSANLSHTDMSGFNSNSIISIESSEVANIFKSEFEQMFNGNFHNAKMETGGTLVNISGVPVRIYFSPKDKPLKNAVVPLINSAKNYIYIPTFVLTERGVAQALINAKRRGVDVKIILDALSASTNHSKHKELRAGGVLVKTENYAGKMHSKSMIIDDKYTVMGSMNFSYSGENKNDENMVIIENEKIAKFYKNFFEYQWNKIDDKWLKFNVRAEGKDSIGSCSDGIDNNYDGHIDAMDTGCR